VQIRVCGSVSILHELRTKGTMRGRTGRPFFFLRGGEGSALSPSLVKLKMTAVAVAIHHLIVNEGGSRPFCTQDGSQVIDAKG